MGQKDKVCKNCKLFVEGSDCPLCRQANFSRSWKGLLVINDPADSQLAAAMSIKAPGKYCVWVK